MPSLCHCGPYNYPPKPNFLAWCSQAALADKLLARWLNVCDEEAQVVLVARRSVNLASFAQRAVSVFSLKSWLAKLLGKSKGLQLLLSVSFALRLQAQSLSQSQRARAKTSI